MRAKAVLTGILALCAALAGGASAQDAAGDEQAQQQAAQAAESAPEGTPEPSAAEAQPAAAESAPAQVDLAEAQSETPPSEAPPPESRPPESAETAAAAVPVIPVPEKPSVAPPPLVEAGAQQLDEIVVTAQKRVQRLVDVPINVSSVSGDDVRRARIEQVRDVAGYIPNVDIKEQVPGAIPVVAIRGVGLDDFSSTNSPAAGVYVDQVTLSSLALMSFDLYDIERIEVLKGPQGTLYGRNSTAGAINVLSAKATTGERAGYFKAGAGTYKTNDLEGMFNLPLGDFLAVRVAGKMIRQGKGFWNSRLQGNDPPNNMQPLLGGLPALGGVPPMRQRDTSGEPVQRDIGKRDILLGRVRLGWEATPYLSLDLKVEGQRQRSEMGQPEMFGTFCDQGSQPIDPDHCTDSMGYSDTDRNPYEGDWRGDFPYTIDQIGQTLIADWDLGWADFSSVTGHIALDRFFHIDVDGQPGDAFDFFQADQVDQWTQELRLGGEGDLGAWLAGAFWSTDTIVVDTDGRHENAIPNEYSHIDADQETKSTAVFGNMDWKLWQGVSLVTGLRYTQEGRDYAGGSTWTVPVPGTISNTWIDSSIRDTNWSWKLGLNYAPGRASLLYANVSKGVKSGGYFSGVTTDNAQLTPYRPEKLVAYEIGAKLQGPLMLNVSAFWYDYTDVQVFMRSRTAPVQLVGNVEEARAYGLDAEALWRGWEGLTVQLGLGLLRTRLGEFTDPSGSPVPGSQPTVIPAGNKLANAPELTFNGMARYELPLFGGDTVAALQYDTHYADAVFKEATNDPLIAGEAYWVHNARLSLAPAERNWELAAWCRNLTDERYVVQGLDVKGFYFGNRNYNAPRTAGVELSVHF
ncbi:MAG TPA: TonB-dependent receptor [Solimonas sp.]|nr:TonB-dependent receptor [Solimonas sp.]